MSGTGQEKLPLLVTPSKSWGSTGITGNSTARGARDTPHGLMEREPGLRTSGKPPLLRRGPRTGFNSCHCCPRRRGESPSHQLCCPHHPGMPAPRFLETTKNTASQSSTQPSECFASPVAGAAVTESLPGAPSSRTCSQHLARASHLHPIVLVIHVLQPGNELSRVETVSDRFVFVSLSRRHQKGIAWRFIYIFFFTLSSQRCNRPYSDPSYGTCLTKQNCSGLQRVWRGGTAVAEPLCSHRAGCTHPALAQNHVRAEEMPVFCGLCISLALPKPVFGYKLI